MSDLFNPFRYLASLLVDLLPAGASDLLIGSAALLGIALVLLALAVPACLLGMIIERSI